MQRTYHYRVYPTKKQILTLESQLAFNCDVYNAALEQRRDWWRRGKSTSFYDQSKELTEVRQSGLAPTEMNAWTQAEALRRLDRAFAGFFRRVKAGTKPGYPRFRSRRRYDSLTWSFSGNAGGCAITQNGRLRLQGIGPVKVKWHRDIHEIAKLCTVTVVRSCGHWYANFSVNLPTPEVANPSPAVGIDVGILSFVTLSTGEQVAGPRAYRAAQAKLRVAQRRVSRRKRGSTGRRRAGLLVARQHEHVRNVRRDHAHKLSRRLVNEFGTIVVENLNLAGMVQNHSLAKHVQDQGWAEFIAMLQYKAEGAGMRIVQVNPKGTSQRCSQCGVAVPKDLSQRVHDCLSCGLVLDRDVNAARNILARGFGMDLEVSTVARRAHAVASEAVGLSRQ